MKYGDLTYLEIRKAAAAGWLAIVPTGCTEQQGPHLPVDFDSWLAERVCLAASARALHDFGIESVVLPTLPFGPTPEHRNFESGFIDLPQELHVKVMYAVLSSLADQGFKSIVVWQGCGQHQLTRVVVKFNEDYKGSSKACIPEQPYSAIWKQLGYGHIPGGHADSFATSIALHLRPELVKREEIVNPNNEEVDWSNPSLDFAEYSRTGVIGDPTQASEAIGERVWEELIKEVAKLFKHLYVNQIGT
jgi:creatinine amidohydrolase